MRDDHLPDTAVLRVFLNDDDPSGFAHRFFDRRRGPMARSSADQSARCSLRCRSVAIASSDFSTVLPQATSVTSEPAWRLRAFPSGIARIGSALFAFRPEHMFRNQKQNRVLAVHRRPKQARGIFRRC